MTINEDWTPTASMIREFKILQMIEDDPNLVKVSPDFAEARMKLHELLGRSCYEECVDDAWDPEPPKWMTNPRQVADYETARAIYVALEKAAAAAPALKLEPRPWPDDKIADWRERYDHAHSKDFPGFCTGQEPGGTSALWIEGQRGIDLCIEWLGIRPKLIAEWAAERNQKT